MKKILIFQDYECTNQNRRKELDECIYHNLQIGFDKVVIMNNECDFRFKEKFIENINIPNRITFKDYLTFSQKPENEGSLIILTNTDIKIDPKILLLDTILKPDHFVCISRYEITGKLAEGAHCTQDTWGIIGKPIENSIVEQSALPLGMPGCENRFVELFYAVNYKLFNPCKDIKNIHIHSFQKNIHLNINRLWGAYIFVEPCLIEDIKNEKQKSHLKYLKL